MLPLKATFPYRLHCRSTGFFHINHLRYCNIKLSEIFLINIDAQYCFNLITIACNRTPGSCDQPRLFITQFSMMHTVHDLAPSWLLLRVYCTTVAGRYLVGHLHHVGSFQCHQVCLQNALNSFTGQHKTMAFSMHPFLCKTLHKSWES